MEGQTQEDIMAQVWERHIVFLSLATPLTSPQSQVCTSQKGCWKIQSTVYPGRGGIGLGDQLAMPPRY